MVTVAVGLYPMGMLKVPPSSFLLDNVIYSRPYWEPLLHVEKEEESCESGTGLTGYDYRLVEQAIKA